MPTLPRFKTQNNALGSKAIAERHTYCKLRTYFLATLFLFGNFITATLKTKRESLFCQKCTFSNQCFVPKWRETFYSPNHFAIFPQGRWPESAGFLQRGPQNAGDLVILRAIFCQIDAVIIVLLALFDL